MGKRDPFRVAGTARRKLDECEIILVQVRFGETSANNQFVPVFYLSFQ